MRGRGSIIISWRIGGVCLIIFEGEQVMEKIDE
jgi:hypothetical protein